MMGKLRVSMLLFLMISSIFFAIAVELSDYDVMQVESVTENITEPVNQFLQSEGVSRQIRIAIYNEPAKALPSYAPSGNITNNYDVIQSILESEGFEVEALQYHQIVDHAITTANYDVFILVDSLPRDDIAYLVKDFWLGGGGILSFNTAMGYLCQFGFLTGIEGDYGMAGHSADPLWMYNAFDDGTFNVRHPAAKDYHIGDTVTAINDSRVIVNNAGLSSIIGNDYADLVYDADDVSDGIAFAVDNHRQGGRIVHLPGNCSTVPTWIQNILPDTLDWLTPRPKARILFDLSHEPFAGIDEWDPSPQPYYLTEWRDALVNRSYAMDKLHPSSEGNLTLANLEPYDMLVIELPYLNFSLQEIADIQTWIANGGSLFISTEASGIPDPYLVRANQIVEPMGIQYNRVAPPFEGSAVPVDGHTTLEECMHLTYYYGSKLNISGDAVPLWIDGAGNILIAASEYGNGRVIATGDTNGFINGWIELNDNLQFMINSVNWLTSSKSEVLLYTTESGSSNYYRTPVADALNDLGVSFYLTAESSYMNILLDEYSWDLAILDGPQGTMSGYYDEIMNYVIGGGKLIMSDYQVDDFSSHSLWATLGFQFTSDAPDQSSIYIREFSSDVFQVPNNYGSANFTPYLDYADEGDRLEVLSHATALAYYSPAYESGTAAIILSDNEQTLYNGYLIDQFQGDLDDSTYMDAFELWENEIAYMLQPTLGQPSNVEYTEGDTGNTITWQAKSHLPWTYSVRRDTEVLYTEFWDGESIVVDIDGLNTGVYQYYVEITDSVGQWRSTAVMVTVHNVTEPFTSFTFPGTSTTNNTVNVTISPDTLTIIIAIIAVTAVVIIVILVIQRKTKS